MNSGASNCFRVNPSLKIKPLSSHVHDHSLLNYTPAQHFTLLIQRKTTVNHSYLEYLKNHNHMENHVLRCEVDNKNLNTLLSDGRHFFLYSKARLFLSPCASKTWILDFKIREQGGETKSRISECNCRLQT